MLRNAHYFTSIDKVQSNKTINICIAKRCFKHLLAIQVLVAVFDCTISILVILSTQRGCLTWKHTSSADRRVRVGWRDAGSCVGCILLWLRGDAADGRQVERDGGRQDGLRHRNNAVWCLHPHGSCRCPSQILRLHCHPSPHRSCLGMA